MKVRISRIGERVWNLQHLFNLQAGFMKADDISATRLFGEILRSGDPAGWVGLRELLFVKHCQVRGWDNDGRPTSRKLSGPRISGDGRYSISRLFPSYFSLHREPVPYIYLVPRRNGIERVIGMKVRVKAFAMLGEIIGKESLIDLPDGSTVREVLDQIASRHRDFTSHVFAPDGSLSSFITVLVNGRNILHVDGLQTLISDGDEVAIFPPVAGG